MEFKVPGSSLKPTSSGRGSKIMGPNSLQGRTTARKGEAVPQMPKCSDIKVCERNGMGYGLLNAFVTWAQGYGEPELGKVTDNPGAWIDFETSTAMGRITYWSSGHCYAEIIDCDTDVTLYQKHWDSLLPEQLDSELLEFFGVLKSK